MTACCFSLPLLWGIDVNCKESVPVLIWHGKRWLFCHTHGPSITNSEPWLYIFCGTRWVYEKTGVRKYIIAMVRRCFGCVNEKGGWLVNSLECSTPGRNWVGSRRAVQQRKFVAIIALCSLGLCVLKMMSKKIYYTRIKSKCTRCFLSWGPWTFGTRGFAATNRLNSWSRLTSWSGLAS